VCHRKKHSALSWRLTFDFVGTSQLGKSEIVVGDRVVMLCKVKCSCGVGDD
jgi:hypothetical protein